MNLLVLNWQDRENPQAGGAEIHLHEVFGRLAERGHRVTAITSGWPGARDRINLDGLDVHRTGGRHTYPVAARHHYRTLSDSFDVVIEDLNKVPLFSPRWARSPVVLLVHHLFGTTAFKEASWPVAAATWLLERPLAASYRDVPVQAVSESTALDLVARGFDRDRIVVIENGVDLEHYTPDPDGRRFAVPTVLYLGRLKRYKRVDLVMTAVAKLVAEGAEVRLIVAGQGSEADRLRSLRDTLGLRGVVEMPGFVDEQEKLRLLRKSWVHVLTSPKEGWGIANIEAAACGTPTIASRSPGLTDSVIDDVTGVLVEHGDVDALALALQRVLGDHTLRTRLGHGARTFAERFTWDRSADLTEAHLEEVLAVTGKRPDRKAANDVADSNPTPTRRT